MVKSFLNRLKKSVADAYDPDREARIVRISNALYEALRTQKQKFNLQQFVAGSDVAKPEIRNAAQTAFRRLIDTIWKDGVVTQQERDTVVWVARCLEISDEESNSIQREYAIEQFQSSLANAMDDGVLSDDEFKHLEHIALTVGMTASALASEYFRSQGEGFVRAMFLSAIEDGELRSQEWSSFVKTARRLGLSDSSTIELIHSPAQQFVEHVLADAKADEVLTDGERKHVESLLARLGLGDNFCLYVRKEMNDFETAARIARGDLPSIEVPLGVEIRAGEIVHFCAEAVLVVTKIRASGPIEDVHRGFVILLDGRAIFQSASTAQSINYRRIVAIGGDGRSVKFQLEGKPIWALSLVQDSSYFALMFRKAVALANQTATRRVEGAPSRHIPRDVRQRVWQRYGAKCVECGAKDYLEFDHIIPVAKGGSNTDANVQLLCRGCNLKKLDRI